MDARDNSPAETETWHEGPSTSWNGVICRCRDGRHSARDWVETVGIEVRPAIIDARAKAGRVRELEAALQETDREMQDAIEFIASGSPGFYLHEAHNIHERNAALLAPTPTEGSDA